MAGQHASIGSGADNEEPVADGEALLPLGLRRRLPDGPLFGQRRRVDSQSGGSQLTAPLHGGGRVDSHVRSAGTSALEHDSVGRVGVLARDEAVGHIGGHVSGIAVEGVTDAASAVPGDSEHVAAAHRERAGLAAERAELVDPVGALGEAGDGVGHVAEQVRGREVLADHRAGQTTGETGGVRHFEAVGHDQRLGLGHAHGERDLRRDATAAAPGARRVGGEPPVQGEQR